MAIYVDDLGVEKTFIRGGRAYRGPWFSLAGDTDAEVLSAVAGITCGMVLALGSKGGSFTRSRRRLLSRRARDNAVRLGAILVQFGTPRWLWAFGAAGSPAGKKL